MYSNFRRNKFRSIMARAAVAKSRFYLTIIMCLQMLALHAQENTVQTKGYYSSDFDIDGRPRYITFYIPAGFGKTDTYPLAIFLHGEGETGKSVIKKYGDKLEKLADSSGWIVLFPDAINGHWSDSSGMPGKDTVNDVGFLSIMIDYFIQRYHCDEEHVYAAGFFNGGQMAWRLACDRPTKIIAIAPFITSKKEAARGCMPSANVAIFNTDKFALLPGKKISADQLMQAWNFLEEHKKM